MFIYVDESGLFCNPQRRREAVSCVGGVVISDALRRGVFKRFKQFKKKHGYDGLELKGNIISETQSAELIDILLDLDVLFFPVVLESGYTTDSEVTRHKLNQAFAIVKHITPRHHPRLIGQSYALKSRIECLPNQLYSQLIVQLLEFETVLRASILHYSQAHPHSLSHFTWRIDAKNKHKTNFDHAFNGVLLPIMQTIYLHDPVICIDGGNYKYFERFFNKELGIPDYLKEHFPEKDNHKKHIDPKQIMTEDFELVDSKNCLGVQIADILVTIFRRALRGNLQVDGWRNLGRLMMRIFPYNRAVRLVHLGSKDIKNASYFSVIRHFEKQARYPLLAH